MVAYFPSVFTIFSFITQSSQQQACFDGQKEAVVPPVEERQDRCRLTGPEVWPQESAQSATECTRPVPSAGEATHIMAVLGPPHASMSVMEPCHRKEESGFFPSLVFYPSGHYSAKEEVRCRAMESLG